MLIRLRKRTTAAERDSIQSLCNELGLRSRFLDDAREMLELEGDTSAQVRSRFEDCSGVQAILEASDAPEAFAKTAERVGTTVRIGPAEFGGGVASVIAGPCAVEDGDRLLEIARAVQNAGALALRGGAFKPRTSPYSFQGAGTDALGHLARARAETGLGVVTELLDVRHLEAVAEVADAFQIGSRSMSNFALLKEVGQTQTPVLLKRGMAATLREFLLAAEYVLAGGNPHVILCERGIRSFDSVTRNVLDVGGVAYLKQTTHLPVIVDPSHAAGRSDLVPALARAGLAAGADGLLVEVHPNPSEAHSDGAQAISARTLAEVVRDARTILEMDGRRLATPQPELT